MRSATVVLPVPGLPVKGHVERGSAGTQPQVPAQTIDEQQGGNIANRLFTGARPTSSRSSTSRTSPTCESRKAASRSRAPVVSETPSFGFSDAFMRAHPQRRFTQASMSQPCSR